MNTFTRCLSWLVYLVCLLLHTQLGGQQVIDQAWINSRGLGPYYLDQRGQTYVLNTDVSTPGTAFVVIAPNVTLNLNNHTVQYNQGELSWDFSNGGFEAGQGSAADGWILTGTAERFRGRFLVNEIFEGEYSLRMAAGTAHAVQCKAAITLQPGVTYSLSAMFQRKPAADGTQVYVQLRDASGNVFHEVAYFGTNNRGIQFKEARLTIGSQPIACTLWVGVRNGSGNEFVFVDDVRLQRTRVYGITVGAFPDDAANYPGVTRFGGAEGFKVINGTITQGKDGGTCSHGVWVRRSSATLSGLNITVRGPDSSVVNWTGREGVIENCNLTSEVLAISSRDQLEGSVVHKFRGRFVNNVIHNGPHVGLNLDGNSTNIVSGNTIRLKTRYTNAFGITARGQSDIYGNRIESHQGEYASRGIMVSSGTVGPVRIHDNTIMCQLLRNNQEYGGGSNQGAVLGGCYGIQLEEGAGNVDVYNNDVTVFANVVRGYAFRASSDSPQNNVRVHHNTFRVVNNGEEAASVKLYGQGTSQIAFEDNTLITNDMWVGDSQKVSGFRLVRPTLSAQMPLSVRVLQSDNGSEVPTGGVLLEFVDPVFPTEADRQRLETAVFVNRRRNNQPDPYSTFTVKVTE